jgi:hypothetical protein
MQFALKRISQNSVGPKLKSFHGKHRGERCFVLGNGSSLNQMDLSHLRNDITFVSNGIHHIFPRIDWRPNYYCCVDSVVIYNQYKDIDKMRSENHEIQCFFPDYVSNPYKDQSHIKVDRLLPPTSNTCYFTQQLPKPKKGPFGLFPRKPGNRLIQPYTVTATLLQLAWIMGCNPIYLIGCDTKYVEQKAAKKLKTGRKQGTKVIEATEDNDPNHFDASYFGKGRRYHTPNVDKMILNYEAINEASFILGFQIINAGIKSDLNVFPKAEYGDLFT